MSQLQVVAYDDTVASITLASGEVHSADLVIAADGVSDMFRQDDGD